MVLGLGASAATALVAASPPILITAIAGLALFGALASAVTGALEEPDHRLVAIITFLVVASGITVEVIGSARIGSAFWGLVVGGLVDAVVRLAAPSPRRGGRRRSGPTVRAVNA